MKTRRIALRSVEAADLTKLFYWRNTEEYRTLVHYDEGIIELAQFEKEFAQDTCSRKYQYIIERISDGEPIGLIFCHTYSTKNGFCFLNIFIEEKYKKLGFGIDALALLCCKLFEDTSFYKVYLEAFSYNDFSIRNIRHVGLKEEGHFKGHKMLNGKRHDVIRFALYREGLGILQKITDHFKNDPLE